MAFIQASSGIKSSSGIGRVASGDGIMVGVGPGGRITVSAHNRTRSGKSTPAHPFKMSNASKDKVLKVKFEPGLVNGQLPTGWTLKDGFTSAALTANSWIWLECVGTFGDQVDTYVVTTQSTISEKRPPGTALTPTGFVSFRLLGLVMIGKPEGSTGGPAITMLNNVRSNQGVESFGITNLWGNI